jgi:hypothetical protein
MSCKTHADHAHKHGASCGHHAITHDGHTDYLHEGHLHHMHSDHVDEHTLSESATNSCACTPDHKCGHHESSHRHGPTCGHEAIPHADHVDYLVNGHLHRPCNKHCDNHGVLASV